MEWTEDLAVGDEKIDAQHKVLFKLSADFRLALDEGRADRTYDILLDCLALFVDAHFAHEERCMTACRCPAAEDNARAHEGFVVMLAGYRARHAARGYVERDAQSLVDRLDGWLADHIVRIDRRLREHLKTG